MKNEECRIEATRAVYKLLLKESTYPQANRRSFRYRVILPSGLRFEGGIKAIGIAHAAMTAAARHSGISHKFTRHYGRSRAERLTQHLHVISFKSYNLSKCLDGTGRINCPRQWWTSSHAVMQSWHFANELKLLIWNDTVELRRQVWLSAGFNKIK
jgi:hypothetical protein